MREDDTMTGEVDFTDTGMLVPPDASGIFTKGDVWALKDDADASCPTNLSKEIKIEDPKAAPGHVKVELLGLEAQESRNVEIGLISKCYEKSGEPTSDQQKSVLDECGEMPMAPEPTIMPIAALSKKVGMHQGDRRRVTPHDQEGRSAKEQLNKIAKYAVELMEKLHDDDELESWIQTKITKAAAYMSAAKHHLEYEYDNPPTMNEYAPMMESTNQKVDEIINEVKKLKKKHSLISESLAFHRLNNIPVTKSFFEVGSEPYINLVAEAKMLWKKGLYKPNKSEKRMFETNIGEWGSYNGKKVPLDCPLTKLGRNGVKGQYSYVKNKKGKTVRVVSSKK